MTPEATMRPMKRDGGQRGSLPLALLVVIIVAGLMVVLVARTIATQSQVRFDQGFHGALPVADSGVDLAKFMLNNDAELEPDDECADASEPLPASEFPVGCATAEADHEIAGKPYTYTLSRTGSERWTVESIGIDPDSGEQRRIVAVFEQSPLIDLALFADVFLNLGGGNQADSYNSDHPSVDDGWSTDPESWCTRLGFVATNGSINFSGAASPDTCHVPDQRTVDRVFLHHFDPDEVDGTTDDTPGGERCGNPLTHANCTEREAGGETWHKPGTEEEPFELEGLGDEQFIAQALDELAGCEEVTFKTGDEGGVLAAGELTFDELNEDEDPEDHIELPGDLEGSPFHCYDTLRFDVDTTIDAEDGRVIIIVDELIIDGGGVGQAVHVNCGGSPDDRCVRGPIAAGGGASTPSADELWIYVRTEVDLGNHSHFAGVIWGPEAACDGGAHADIYGSLVCRSVPHNLGGWRFHYDEQLLGVKRGEYRLVDWTEEL